MVINSCDFALNGPANSVVYIGNSCKVKGCIIPELLSSTFTRNQGVPVYIFLSLNNVSFKENQATAGGAFYSSNSIIKFDDKGNVNFDDNSANNGGAVYQIRSTIFFRENTVVMFTSNIAAYGEAIYQISSKLCFINNAVVNFTRNVVRRSFNTWFQSKGVVFSRSSLVSFDDWSIVTFDENRAVNVLCISQSKTFFSIET